MYVLSKIELARNDSFMGIWGKRISPYDVMTLGSTAIIICNKH